MKRGRRNKQNNFVRVTGLYKSRYTPDNARFMWTGRVQGEYLEALYNIVDAAYHHKRALRFFVAAWRDSGVDGVLSVAYDGGAESRGRRDKYDDDEDEGPRRRPPSRGRARRDDHMKDEGDKDDLFDDDGEDEDEEDDDEDTRATDDREELEL